MIRTVRAESLEYDAARDTATLTVGEPLGSGGNAGGRGGSAQLLLDKNGFLVGVDLGGGGFGRVAVMLGRHEDVATTRAASVVVESAGQSSRVRFTNARAHARAHERNPYA